MADAPDLPKSMTATLAAKLQDRSNGLAMTRFVAKYREEMVECCLRFGLQPADAEEVTNEVLLRFLEEDRFRLYTFQGAVAFRGWLTTVVLHAVRSFQRKVSARNKKIPRGLGNFVVQESLEGAEDYRLTESAAEAVAAEMFAQHQREMELGQKAMAEVKDRCSDNPKKFLAFCLTALEGRSGAEAARELGMTVANVHQARCRVAKMLQEVVARLRAEGPPPP